MKENHRVDRRSGFIPAAALLASVMALAAGWAGGKGRQFTVPAEGTPAYQSMQAEYQDKISPILEAKCFMCHSNGKNTGAVKLMDMTDGFPFKGVGSADSRIAVLNQEVTDNDMPPFYYLVFHWMSGLSKTERAAIINWTEMCLDLTATGTGNAGDQKAESAR